jgi:hypothetical protein
VSYDVDAFMDSATIIKNLVPVRNDDTRSICWNRETQRADFQYSGHRLKLIVKGVGEIDFPGASPLLADATTSFEFDGRFIARERPAEIIAKKIYYCGPTFKSRDVFDLAGTYIALRDELTDASTSPLVTARRVALFRSTEAVQVTSIYAKGACSDNPRAGRRRRRSTLPCSILRSQKTRQAAACRVFVGVRPSS